MPLEAEAQEFLNHKPWEINKRQKAHTLIPSQELMHRAYLFYTEEGRPMYFEDFQLFAQDFEIVPRCLSMDELRQLYAISPRSWLSVQDFVALISACASFGHKEVHVPSFLEEMVKHKAMGPVVEWFDAQTNGLPADQWRMLPQQSTFELFKPYLDPLRKDEPIRLTDHPYLETHRDEIESRPCDSILLPTPHLHAASAGSESEAKGHLHGASRNVSQGKEAPWQAQIDQRNAMRNAKVRGTTAPGKSWQYANRSPAPYGTEPKVGFSDTATSLLDEFCGKHRVDLQLLFDSYGFRDYEDPVTGEKDGIITGAELHKLIWDAGLIASRGRAGVHPDVRDYYKECVGNVYRETLRLNFFRFKTMLVRTVERMSKARDHVRPEHHVLDAARDLVRDYLAPLCHALFWKDQ